MTSLQLEDGVRSLLETELDSFEKLEIARLLCATQRPMSRAEISAAGALSQEVVDDALSSLKKARLVEWDGSNGEVRLGPSTTDPHFVRLMQLYGEDRASVMAVLSALVMQRLRSMTVRAFADAFLFRKKRDPDG